MVLVLLRALQAVVDPETGRDFVAAKQLRNLRIEGGDVAFDVELGYPAKSRIDALRKSLIAAARSVPGVANVSIWGQRDQQLQVQVDPKRLRDRGVTLRQIIDTTGNAQVASPISYLEASTPGTGGIPSRNAAV